MLQSPNASAILTNILTLILDVENATQKSRENQAHQVRRSLPRLR